MHSGMLRRLLARCRSAWTRPSRVDCCIWVGCCIFWREKIAVPRVVEREVLPSRRAAETRTIRVNGTVYQMTSSRYPDGRLAEIFLTANKTGSQVDMAARDAAVVASIACQFGVPMDVLRHSLSRDARGLATGPLGTALDILAAD